MRATYITAIIIAVAITVWLFSGQVGEEAAPTPGSLAEQNAAMSAQQQDEAPTRVRVRVVDAQMYTERLVLRGRTENKRTVEVLAEAAGRIVERPIERGARVAAGDLLCRVAMDDRQAGLAEAREALNQSQIEYRGALRLKAQGFQSETAIAQAKARLAAAQAQVERRQIEINRTAIRAPFDGIVEETGLEVGDFVSPGGVCATVVDLNPMLLVGAVPEVDVAHVHTGTVATGYLVDGRVVEGELSFVGQQSDPQTRTYPIEIQVDNSDMRLRSGITAEIQLPMDEVLAHRITPALLALDDAGDIGVRTVDEEGRVVFNLVQIIDDEAGGVWLTGLPERATVITVGQELVVPGELVEVEYESSGDMPAKAPRGGAPVANELPENGRETGGVTELPAKAPVHIAAQP